MGATLVAWYLSPFEFRQELKVEGTILFSGDF
jgi:hypothetical protein